MDILGDIGISLYVTHGDLNIDLSTKINEMLRIYFWQAFGRCPVSRYDLQVPR